jgi:hypothetical protein
VELLHEARRAAREAQVSGKLITIPYEVSLLAGSDDALGTPVLSAPRVSVIRFNADFGYLNWGGRLFRGTLEVTTDDAGDMIVVNEVETGRYLASVTGAESPSSWHDQALASQAIAARTYLVTHLHRHDHYDLEGDVRDQEYAGIGTEADSNHPRRRTDRGHRRDLPWRADRSPVFGERGRRHRGLGERVRERAPLPAQAFRHRVTSSRRTAAGARRAGTGTASSPRRSSATTCARAG